MPLGHHHYRGRSHTPLMKSQRLVSLGRERKLWADTPDNFARVCWRQIELWDYVAETSLRPHQGRKPDLIDYRDDRPGDDGPFRRELERNYWFYQKKVLCLAKWPHVKVGVVLNRNVDLVGDRVLRCTPAGGLLLPEAWHHGCDDPRHRDEPSD